MFSIFKIMKLIKFLGFILILISLIILYNENWKIAFSVYLLVLANDLTNYK